MRTVAEYRKFAESCRELAARLTNANDKRGMELMAEGWDKAAEQRQAAIAANLVLIPPETPK